MKLFKIYVSSLDGKISTLSQRANSGKITRAEEKELAQLHAIKKTCEAPWLLKKHSSNG